MGKILRYKNRVEIRIGIDEILTAKLAASQNVIFTLAEMISKYARIKAEENMVDLPGGVIATSFDPACLDFVITFTNSVEDAY
jgi:hypothetical protein